MPAFKIFMKTPNSKDYSIAGKCQFEDGYFDTVQDELSFNNLSDFLNSNKNDFFDKIFTVNRHQIHLTIKHIFYIKHLIVDSILLFRRTHFFFSH